jgi:ribosome-associated protein
MSEIKKDLIIPEHELIITTSRAGGPGGQHVNKTDSRVTLHWNIHKTAVLTDAQKQRVLQKLRSQLNEEGVLAISCGTTRSQIQNRRLATQLLIQKITKALHVPKRRIKTTLPGNVKQKRLQDKRKHSEIKKLRRDYE